MYEQGDDEVAASFSGRTRTWLAMGWDEFDERLILRADACTAARTHNLMIPYRSIHDSHEYWTSTLQRTTTAHHPDAKLGTARWQMPA